MSNEYSGAMRKTVNRAGFFKWGAESVKRFSKELISYKLEEMKDIFATTAEWKKVTDEKAVGTRPRLFFVNGTPFFVVNDGEAGINAFSANCPEEGGLLEWRENQASFCCPFCQSKYDKMGNALNNAAITLLKHDTQIIEGQLMVKLDQSSKHFI